eukprot:scaffold35851_cov44-Attheya_sp.AAC.1
MPVPYPALLFCSSSCRLISARSGRNASSTMVFQALSLVLPPIPSFPTDGAVRERVRTTTYPVGYMYWYKVHQELTSCDHIDNVPGINHKEYGRCQASFEVDDQPEVHCLKKAGLEDLNLTNEEKNGVFRIPVDLNKNESIVKKVGEHPEFQKGAKTVVISWKGNARVPQPIVPRAALASMIDIMPSVSSFSYSSLDDDDNVREAGRLLAKYQHPQRATTSQNPHDLDKRLPGSFDGTTGHNALVNKRWCSLVLHETRGSRSREAAEAKKIRIAEYTKDDPTVSWTARLCAMALCNDMAGLQAAFHDKADKTQGYGAAMKEQGIVDYADDDLSHTYVWY